MGAVYRGGWERFVTKRKIARARARCARMKYGGGTLRFDLSREPYDGVRALMFEEGTESLVKKRDGDDRVWVDSIFGEPRGDSHAISHTDTFDYRSGKSYELVEIPCDEWPCALFLRCADFSLAGYRPTRDGDFHMAVGTSLDQGYIYPFQPERRYNDLPDMLAVVRYTSSGPRCRRYAYDVKLVDDFMLTPYFGEWRELCKPLT